MEVERRHSKDINDKQKIHKLIFFLVKSRKEKKIITIVYSSSCDLNGS